MKKQLKSSRRHYLSSILILFYFPVVSAFSPPVTLRNYYRGRHYSVTTKKGGRCDYSSSSPLAVTDGNHEPSSFVDATYSSNAGQYNSHISQIKSKNLAGFVQPNFKDIVISLGNHPNLVAVTGETGTGKSLLMAKTVDLVTGGKATASYVPTANSATPLSEGSLSLIEENAILENKASVEMVLRLSEPHLSLVQDLFVNSGLDPSLLFLSKNKNDDDNDMGTLVLKRVISMGDSASTAGTTTPSSSATTQRLKSNCEINGVPVTLKTLKTIAGPLVVVIDAAAAATALSKPTSRMAIIDSAVPPEILVYARTTKMDYGACRKRRESLERELANRVLPLSFSSSTGAGSSDDPSNHSDEDLELLQHWIEELDDFEAQIARFCDSIQPDSGADAEFSDVIFALTEASWASSGENEDISSSLYSNLLEFRDAIKSLDEQIGQAYNACQSLGSLSVPDSAATALQKARNSLYDAVGVSTDGPVSNAAEKVHDLLNTIESDLEECVRAIEDDHKGLVQVLERARSSVDLSIEEIDQIIVDWNVLARKHGISPYVLPTCHKSLRSELDGNVEARQLLPESLEKEKSALARFEVACEHLTKARKYVANTLSLSVTNRLPSLGMDTSAFDARLMPEVRKCTDLSAYGPGSGLGLDGIDFLLLHDQKESISAERMQNPMEGNKNYMNHSKRGGKVDVVASAGEKARILLAIETELPGSIGASCGSSRSTSEATYSTIGCPPVAVLYDEIDAHVGGRAAVSLANMLADQTRQKPGSSRGREQVISITHSPSVAAIADLHLVVQRVSHPNMQIGTSQVLAGSVDGQERRQELARMASGDLATDEAEIFADALIREGIKQRNLEA